MNIDSKLYEMIKFSGIDLILSLPCIMLKNLLHIIDKKEEIQHIPITREEEGVGIAAGAYLGGKTPAIIMQNSGLGNSINAIESLLKLYKIPIIFIMSHRGAEGEKIIAQIPMGKLTPKLLDLLSIKKFIIDSPEKIKVIEKAVNFSKKSLESVGILLKKQLWGKAI
ncbi:MAG: sulfopyruvate decarboxylase subunit alpha [Promethearchaeota archaeon]